MRLADLRLTDLALVAAFGLLVLAMEHRNRVDLGVTSVRDSARTALITCPLRKPDFATVMQAAFLGDGTLIVEQQTDTKVRHIKDC